MASGKLDGHALKTLAELLDYLDDNPVVITGEVMVWNDADEAVNVKVTDDRDGSGSHYLKTLI
jgi:hypothetical protein